MAPVFGVTDFWTYVLGTVAIVLLPGPNSLFVVSTAARDGVRAGYRAAAGVFLGDWVLMLCAAAGVASLLRAYPPVFLAVKYGGGIYLGYVGITMVVGAWRRRGAPPDPAEATPVTTDPPASAAVRRPFRRALVISLLNPKAILFFISFFIQFLDPAYPYPALSFLVLGGVVQVCSAIYLSCLIFGGRYLAAQLRRRRLLGRALVTGVGAIFVGFGVRLATASLG
jgi:leucine efflux protein